jgi:hypothetical protein
VDWPPIFDFFRFREIKPAHEIDKIEFYTASPGVSSKSHFIEIHQQEIPFEISSFNFKRDSISNITTKNVAVLNIDLEKMGNTSSIINVDDLEIQIEDTTAELSLLKKDTSWQISYKPPHNQKGPHRNGGFKDAFRNNMVLVYASKGTKKENEWWYHRALFDAEKFYYRGNGNIELVKDIHFSREKYPDQNVIIYGNRDNNMAWESLLITCPIQVQKGKISLQNRSFEGEDFGIYFIYPREDSDIASIGVVSATGEKGRKATYANLYLENGTTFPDVIIVNSNVIKEGLTGIVGAGFFSNDWSIEKGDFVWRK